MKIVIPGDPIPQPRARCYRRGNLNIFYDPAQAKKVDIRECIKEQLKDEFPELPVFHSSLALSICIIFEMPIPQSWSKKKRELHIDKPHISKPDIDNLEVIVFNTLSGIVYHDDRQISHTKCVKRYSLDPKTVIEISEYGEKLCLST